VTRISDSVTDYVRDSPFRLGWAEFGTLQGLTGMDPRKLQHRSRARALIAAAFALLAFDAAAQTPISLFQSFVGNVNYQVTGGSLRSAANTSNACSLNPSSSALLQGIPATAAIRAAYLYWAGSGSTPDTAVTLNGVSISADRVFTDTFAFNGTDYDFFSGFADVTGVVSGNGNQSFSGLSVDNGAPFCNVQTVVAGWSIVVVYEDSAEDLRAVNLFDGFELFRASSVTLTVDTFRIPPAPINGKVTHITFEGDPQNSGTLGGFSESLSFNGTTLDDGLVPSGSSPTVQQFDGTVNTLGVTTSYGLDVDTYDVSALLNAGDTSASTTYSSGQDLVLLSAEVISFTTEPVADLSISKTHSGTFTVGSNGDYLIQVLNLGPEPEANAILVTDTLPAGLTFVSGVGTDWTCAAVGADVSCMHPGPLAVGESAPPLTLAVAVGLAAVPSVANTATVSSASLDANPANDSSSDPTVVLSSNLSTSIKSVIDTDGGDADPGDTLRYTITLSETGGFATTGVRVTDDIPGLTSGFTVVSIPMGATDASTGFGTGANGAGFLDVSGISVPASSSVDIVFEVGVAAGANPGDIIANQASIANPLGPGATVNAPNVIVSESQIPSGGTKPLYLYDSTTVDPNGFNQGPQPYLSRTPAATAQNNVGLSKNVPPVVWTMTPGLQAPLSIDSGTIPITLNVSKGGANGNLVTRRLTVALSATGASTGPIGTPVTQTFSAPSRNSPATVVFNVPIAAPLTLLPGTQITLTLTNTTPGGGARLIRVFPVSGAVNSRIDLPALTVINVDSIGTFDAAFPGTAAQATFASASTASLRANVSDPFGLFDIASVAVTVTDPNTTPIVTNQAMTLVAPLSGAQATYELLFNVPPAANAGLWTFRVTAVEGLEGTVRHSRSGAFLVGATEIMVTKSVLMIQDPVNGTVNPKAIPGATALYTLTLANLGTVPADASSLLVTDRLPSEAALFVNSASGDPISFIDGTPTSGLNYNYAADVLFSNQPGGGPPFTYAPTPNANGFDPAVTGFIVNPGGSFNGLAGGVPPQFEIRYRIEVQ
jgi:uncharacterized repeat protein (TIGR01451 family)